MHPTTEVVIMPDECQSMPMTEPKAWNQKGSPQAREQLGRTVVDENALGDCSAEPGHAIGQPGGHASAVERKISVAGASHLEPC